MLSLSIDFPHYAVVIVLGLIFGALGIYLVVRGTIDLKKKDSIDMTPDPVGVRSVGPSS